MNNWLRELAELQQQNTDCVMLTVASIVGSTPREVGCKMIVTSDQIFGTIGGGNLEYQATSIARDLLDNPQPLHLKRFPLGAGLGQCCGGLVNLLFEPVVGACDWLSAAIEYEGLDREWVREVPMRDGDSQVIVRSRLDEDRTGLVGNCFIEVSQSKKIELTLFGAGHVGRAIVSTMQDLPVKIRWVDSRDSEFPGDLWDNIEVIVTDSPEAEVDAAKPGACFLVMTHEHALDQMLCEHILKRDDFTFFGLIGSKAKRRMFESRMQRRGIEVEKFSRMICPVGVEGINGKQPAMIALSVAAQIMQVYDACQKSEQLEIQNKRSRAVVNWGIQ
ncbi:MAG: xanthine dehydrogenase accessory protein XdhC [Gammaproteobacteria bacterium]|nr:xanthine dehydrogenase accessory protein XdhC [Gammaproteobacteria bacterium]MCP4981643.1 xanthine dehydrogenase accessory protein XdhC [Gammaproteobacteria bacterium]